MKLKTWKSGWKWPVKISNINHDIDRYGKGCSQWPWNNYIIFLLLQSNSSWNPVSGSNYLLFMSSWWGFLLVILEQCQIIHLIFSNQWEDVQHQIQRHLAYLFRNLAYLATATQGSWLFWQLYSAILPIWLL